MRRGIDETAFERPRYGLRKISILPHSGISTLFPPRKSENSITIVLQSYYPCVILYAQNLIRLSHSK